jgi:transcriptional regulator with XRE-family HTH domain
MNGAVLTREAIRRRRLAIGFTQAEIGEIAGTSQQTVEAFENGSRPVSAETGTAIIEAVRLAEAYAREMRDAGLDVRPIKPGRRPRREMFA